MHGGGGWAGSPPALCGSRHTDGSLCMLPSPKNPSEQEAKQIAAGEEKPGLLGVHVLPFILKAITDTRPASCSHYRAFPADYMQPSRAHTTRLCMLALMVGDWRARPQSSSETSFKKKCIHHQDKGSQAVSTCRDVSRACSMGSISLYTQCMGSTLMGEIRHKGKVTAKCCPHGFLQPSPLRLTHIMLPEMNNTQKRRRDSRREEEMLT